VRFVSLNTKSRAHHAPTRPLPHARPLGGSVFRRRPLRVLARLRRPRLRRNAHRFLILLWRDASVRRPRHPEFLSARFGSGASYLLGATTLLAYLIYVVGTNTFAFSRAGAIAAIVFIPLALAASAERQPPGAWQDYLTLAGIWVTVKFSPSHWLWPYPNERLAYVFTVLLCLNVALAAFVLIRKIPGIGYNIGWGRRWSFFVVASFLVFAAIAIPLGTGMHFIHFAPQWYAWLWLPFLSIAIIFFTAWPEEFLFRGLLQNMLSRSSKSDLAGWWTASVLFGFSHITNFGFPNWRYVILASIAGLFYGWTWRRTNSIFASALVHAAVDATWHFFFRTV
jgi:membrane protease YdiL (CAAX protease family)